MRHSLLYTTLLLDATIASAKEDITRRECELIHVNDLLSRVIKERHEAQAKCQKLMLEKLELQQKQQLEQHQFVQTHQRDTISQSEEEQQEGFSEKHSASSDCEENNRSPSLGGSWTTASDTSLSRTSSTVATPSSTTQTA